MGVIYRDSRRYLRLAPYKDIAIKMPSSALLSQASLWFVLKGGLCHAQAHSRI
jgi:hypothetical protein